jgi:hypothetical protein
MCIAWNGKVAQCYSDYMMDNILGDVGVNTVKEIWLGDKFNELRKLMKSGRRLFTKPCRTCSDGGVIEKEVLRVGKRRMTTAHYVHQGIDVKDIGTEPARR